MTQEEIAKVKAMTVSERIRRFLPKLREHLITEEQYAALLRLGTSVQHNETAPTSQSNTPPMVEIPEVSHGGDVAYSRESEGAPSQDALTTLAQQFGGYVLPVAPERNGNEDRAQDTLWEHRGSTNHEDKHKGLSQKARLLKLLSDGLWHSTIEIQQVVYGGSHLGVARIGARIHDLTKEGHKIQSRKEKGAIWQYRKELSETARNLASG